MSRPADQPAVSQNQAKGDRNKGGGLEEGGQGNVEAS